MCLGQNDVLDMGIMELHFIENPGMAFGTEFGGSTGKMLLSLFRLVAIGGIGYYLYTLIKRKAPVGLVVSIALVFSGAFGNLIDSLFYGLIFNESPMYHPAVGCMGTAEMFPDQGYAGFLHGKVVDMFHFTPSWPEGTPWVGGTEVFPPVFNVADTAITVGVAMIIIWQKRYFPKKEKEVETEGGNADPGSDNDATPQP